MNSSFTEKAERALDFSLAIAREMGHTYVGSEHILMGLLSVTDSVAYRVLTNHGVTLANIKELVETNVGCGTPSSVTAANMTPMTKKIIEESAYTAKRLGSDKIGTEHILAAIISEGDCFASKMIRQARASVGEIRNELSQSFGAPRPKDGGQRKDQGKEKGLHGFFPFGRSSSLSAAERKERSRAE